jgi:hypothetical protein
VPLDGFESVIEVTFEPLAVITAHEDVAQFTLADPDDARTAWQFPPLLPC